DGDGGHLPGVVDPKDLRHPHGGGAPAGTRRDRLGAHALPRSRRAAATLSATKTMEATAFQPAMESPAIFQAGWSQAGNFWPAPFKRSFSACAVTAPPPEQLCGPGQNFHSTPAW